MNNQKPCLEILEQPANCGIRFRYSTEKFGGKLQGGNTGNQKKSYPTIIIKNYEGPLKIMISCVTSNPPYMQHPNTLTSETNEAMNEGVYLKTFPENPGIIEIRDLRIHKSKRKEIKNNLLIRKEYNIDPTKAGFDYIEQDSSQINLERVRLCFQVIYKNKQTDSLTKETEPVISDEMFDRRDDVMLHVYHVSLNNISSSGGKVMLFTSCINKKDIEVLMIVENNGIKTEKRLDIVVHRKAGVVFNIPPFQYPNEKRFEIILRRPSDEMMSCPVEFNYYQTTIEDHTRCDTNRVDQETQTNSILELPDPSDFNDIEMDETSQDSLEQLLVPRNSELLTEEDLNEFHDWLLPFEDL